MEIQKSPYGSNDLNLQSFPFAKDSYRKILNCPKKAFFSFSELSTDDRIC